ncbi:MAG TPA: ATP phosphoribosyltransferase [Solirubrobacteraceae bacterium]|jgi:ATP phosphoribosyltransferase
MSADLSSDVVAGNALAALTIAVPRGALLTETLDLLDGLGLDTAELRSNDRKLLFEDVGALSVETAEAGTADVGTKDAGTKVSVITMRPSDVPTYVEAGAADLGITGKDVLLEQAGIEGRGGGREVYELLDLGFGGCTMVLATTAGENAAGEHAAAEALRRLGVMRVATKYPRTALAHMESTGRQVEIVEVKGSVELAPLTGLAEAIVDLTATGTTLRENGLVVREEIVYCTARLIANPVAHMLKARAIDDLVCRLRGA